MAPLHLALISMDQIELFQKSSMAKTKKRERKQEKKNVIICDHNMFINEHIKLSPLP